MNPYIKDLNRIEVLITLACTGQCRHCSEGDHLKCSEHIDGDGIADLVRKVCHRFQIESLMTFGGEPLLYPEAVYKIHSAAKKMLRKDSLSQTVFSAEIQIRSNTRLRDLPSAE